jgi:hypothetical protein
LDKSDPRAARNAFLDTLPVEEQALVLRQAEKLGPLPSDSDWLVAYAAERSATRIEAAIASFEARANDVAKKDLRTFDNAVAVKNLTLVAGWSAIFFCLEPSSVKGR